MGTINEIPKDKMDYWMKLFRSVVGEDAPCLGDPGDLYNIIRIQKKYDGVDDKRRLAMILNMMETDYYHTNNHIKIGIDLATLSTGLVVNIGDAIIADVVSMEHTTQKIYEQGNAIFKEIGYLGFGKYEPLRVDCAIEVTTHGNFELANRMNLIGGIIAGVFYKTFSNHNGVKIINANAGFGLLFKDENPETKLNYGKGTRQARKELSINAFMRTFKNTETRINKLFGTKKRLEDVADAFGIMEYADRIPEEKERKLGIAKN